MSADFGEARIVSGKDDDGDDDVVTPDVRRPGVMVSKRITKRG